MIIIYKLFYKILNSFKIFFSFYNNNILYFNICKNEILIGVFYFYLKGVKYIILNTFILFNILDNRYQYSNINII